MHKLLTSALLFLILTMPYSVFSHSGEEHEHDEPAADSSPQLESGNGWRVVRSIEMGTSGKFVHMVLIDHSVYTDKTIYSAAINRLCRSEEDFVESDSGVRNALYPKKPL